MPKGRKKKIRHTTVKHRRYGFRSRSKTAGGRDVIRRRRRKRGKFAR